MTENIFAAVLGPKLVKWDAFWHLFRWLLDPEEGHSLGGAIRKRLVKYVFDGSDLPCEIRLEYPVSGQTDGRGKWADLALGFPDLNDPKLLIVMDDIGHRVSGARRKLLNLVSYLNESSKHHPSALVRAVAITDAPSSQQLASAVVGALGVEAADYLSAAGWKLLHLERIGAWVRDSMTERDSNISEKMKTTLEDFADWCEGKSD